MIESVQLNYIPSTDKPLKIEIYGWHTLGIQFLIDINLSVRIYRSTHKVSNQSATVVMVTCNSCGYEYESRVLQTPDEETLRSEPVKI